MKKNPTPHVQPSKNSIVKAPLIHGLKQQQETF